MRTVVCDAGPLIHLCEADLLGLLRSCGEVFVPPAVQREAESVLMSWPAWLRIKGLNETSERVSALRCRVLEIHRGESAAIALAEELKADWFLTDDAGARLLAGAMGFEVHGSLGVVLWNAAQGQLDRTAAKQALQALDRSSLWISAAILREADQAIEDIFPQP